MARALASKSEYELKPFTDCLFFINGHCKLNDKCRYRHCREAAAQTNNCFKWPKVCRNVNCPYRHPSSSSPAAAAAAAAAKKKVSIPEPLMAVHPSQSAASSPPRQEGLISFFWDIENVPIPRGQKPFDIVQRIRQKLVIEAGLREYNFTCYCNSTTIPQDNQLSLFHANVRIVHVPDRKSGAVDRQIMLELDRFERAHRPPATIVLISGDIDFVGKLSDLRHQAGFHVIVIHNKPAKEELKATVNAHYSWETFTQPQVQQRNEASGFNNLISELTIREPQPYRLQNTDNSGILRRKDPSPSRSSTPVKQRTVPNTRETKKQIYHCPKCTNEFDSVSALRQHQDAKDHLFDCPSCDESFVTLDGLVQHQKAKGHHVEEYKCEQCSRRFTKIDSLNQHRQSTGHVGMTAQPLLTTSNGFVHVQSPPRSSPNTNQNTNDFVQDATMAIMQKGIEAIAQLYPKIFQNNK